MTTISLRVGGHSIEVDNADKVFFPNAGLTKAGLIEYYRRIAGTILPYLEGRPLSMQRFPDGIQAGGFYQKEAPGYFPDWIQRVDVDVEEEDTTQPQVVCGDEATLVYLVDQGCITPHIWLSRVPALRKPDKLIFDLDPGDGGFELVRTAAFELRGLLDEVGLGSFVMTTGSRGLHVAVPLDAGAGFETVRAFARDLARVLVSREPERYTLEMRKKDRGPRLFLDYLRNSYAQTSVSPYAVRPKEGAPVATPLDWNELEDRQLHSQSYRVENLFHRLGQKEDPWKGFRRQAYSLAEPQRKLGEMED